VLEAARSESDVVSLKALSLARPSSFYTMTTSLGPFPREPIIHSMLMIFPSGLPSLIHWKLLTLSRRTFTTLKNLPRNGAFQLIPKNVKAPSLVRTSIKLRINPSSHWLAPLLHLTLPPSSSVWPLTEFTPLVHIFTPSVQSSRSIASASWDPSKESLF